jgi:hypothetical protein
MDPSGEVRMDYRPVPMPPRIGTRISLVLPASAGQRFAPEMWARAFALFNPHASVKIRWFRIDSEPRKRCDMKTDEGGLVPLLAGLPSGQDEEFFEISGVSA